MPDVVDLMVFLLVSCADLLAREIEVLLVFEAPAKASQNEKRNSIVQLLNDILLKVLYCNCNLKFAYKRSAIKFVSTNTYHMYSKNMYFKNIVLVQKKN